MSGLRLILHGQGQSLKKDGGVGRYSHELYKRVQSPRIQNYLPAAEVEGWEFPSSEETSGSNGRPITSKVQKELKAWAKNWIPPRIVNSARSALSGESAVRSSSATIAESNERIIFHEVTNYSSCLEIARLTFQPSLKLCVTFIDLQDLYYPEYFSDEVLRSRRFHYLFYKESAHQFFAISEFTRQTMIERLGIPAERIKVTHLAGDGFQRHVDPEQNAYAQTFGRYLIYPAKFWKHKNHEFLLKAFSARREEFKRHGLQLVLTGGFTPEETLALQKMAQENGIDSQVQILGFQSAAALSALVRNAYFLVFPSLFEGFGMPILEALESSCPVICSRQGSLPEVAGDAAIYFDPLALDSLVAIFDDLLNGSIDRAGLIEKGKQQCRKFNWDRTFTDTAEEYAKLL